MADDTCWCASAISPGMMSWMPANRLLVMRDWPRSDGFSSTSTRRSASSAVITSPASSISFLTSSNFQMFGEHLDFGSLVTTLRSTSHSGAMSFLVILS